MNILVFGAGVIGTVYASKLRQAGNAVTVLARGARLEDIRRHGLILESVVDRRRSECRVEVTEGLSPRDRYDLISTSTAEYTFGAHARAAAGEMLEVARDCRALGQTAGVDAVSWQRLMTSIESHAGSSPASAI